MAALASDLTPAGGAPPAEADSAGSLAGPGSLGDLDDLLWRHVTQVTEPELLPRVVDFFGLAFLRGVTTFTLVELVNELGLAVFEGGRAGLGGFRLMALFRPAGIPGNPDAAGFGGAAVAFRHVAYQELLAAEFLRTAHGRATALGAPERPRLTEQVRQFLSRRGGGAAGTDDCVPPAGVYVVGPSHHLMLRRIERPVRLDRFPVTVSRYKRFLHTVGRGGSAQWDHPAMPAGYTHQPWRERLRVPGYYDHPGYDNHPAIAVNWWSAYAFARFEGKRLPTSLEWEAAARGTDGRAVPLG